MPFASRRQQKWAFANKKPFAKRWAKQTNFASLPASKDAGTDAGAMAHGPGGLLATPGLGRGKRRRWGIRTKATQIAGNLYRGNDGKFQAGGADSAPAARGVQLSKQPTPQRTTPAKTPKGRSGGGKGGKGRSPAKPKQTPEQRQQARQAEHDAQQAQNRDAVKNALMDADAALGPTGVQAVLDAADGKPIADGAGLAKLGMAEQNPDGSYRLTSEARALAHAANQGDSRAALDAIGRAGSRTERAQQRQTAQQQRQQELAQRNQERAQRDAERQKKQAAAEKKRASGGGSKQPTTTTAPKAPTAAQQRAEANRQERQAQQDRRNADAIDLMTAGGKLRDTQLENLIDAGLAERQGLVVKLTPAGNAIAAQKRARQTTKAAGNPGDYLVVEDRAKPSTWHLQVKRNGKVDHGLMGSAWAALHSGFRGNVYQGPQKQQAIQKLRALYAAEKMDVPATKSFTIYKDARGQHRWLARTTTAYRDRDDEILETAALDADSVRMTATKQFGPLRYWHIGQPDPGESARPWGPGVDLGMCDYSVVIGRTRVESGTFASAQLAQQVAAVADQHEMSPGFFHPEGQPGPDGVFSSMRTFERSLVPMRYARASNLFTGFTVKEHRMDLAEMERRFKAAITELGLDAAQAAALGAELVATEKAASQQQIAFKEADAPAPPEEIVIGGVTYTIKAASADEPAEVVEEKAAGDMPMGDMPDAETPMETAAEGGVEEPGEMDGEDVIGNMTPAEFWAQLADYLAPVLKMQDMVKSIGDMHGELKSMYGGTATKEAGNTAEIATIKAQQQTLAARLAQLEGDQPAVGLPADVEAALKSAGPQAPADPTTPTVPDRPFAGAAAAIMPELYSSNMRYGPNGWEPRPQS